MLVKSSQAMIFSVFSVLLSLFLSFMAFLFFSLSYTGDRAKTKLSNSAWKKLKP